MKIGIGGKLALSIELAMLLITVVFGLTTYFVVKNVFRDQAYDKLQSIAVLKESRIKDFINNAVQEIEFFNNRSTVKQYLLPFLVKQKQEDKDMLASRVEDALKYNQTFMDMLVMDKNGVVVFSSNASEEGKIREMEPIFINSRTGTYIQNYYLDLSIGTPVMMIGAPILNQEGDFLGVMAGRINVNTISTIMAERTGLGATGETFLVNSFNMVVTELLKQPGEAMKKTLYLPQITSCLQGGTDKFNNIDYFEDKVLGYYNWVPELKSCLVTKIDEVEVMAPSNRIFSTMMLVLLGGAFISGLFGYLGANTIIAPVKKLLAAMVRIKEGDFEVEIDVKTNDEIGEMAKAFGEMALRLKSFYRDLENKVREKTSELTSTLSKLEEQNVTLEESKTAILNVMDDLNEEKEKIGAEKNRIETILRSIGDGVFVTDNEGRVIMVNQAAEKIVGKSSIEILNRNYKESFKFAVENEPKKKYPDFVKEAIEKGKTESLLPYSVLMVKDENPIPVLDSAAPLKTLEGKVFGCVVVFRDNTKERELEKSKDEFLSVASHQLRTPLGGMRWNLELMMDGDFGKMPVSINKPIVEIHETTLMMISLVNDLLNVSRIDQGRVMDEPIETDLGELLKQKIADLNPLADQEKVDVQLTLGEKMPKVLIDPKRFGETVTNLVSNSIKYHKDNGWVKVHMGMTTDKKHFQLTIADNGIGIPKDAEHRLFGKFFRADNALKKHTEGSGLGLYIAKKFIDSWGGNIRVESKVGVGTTFVVLLPRIIKQPEVHKDDQPK